MSSSVYEPAVRGLGRLPRSGWPALSLPGTRLSSRVACPALLSLACLLYVAFTGSLSIIRHASIQTSAYDLGIYVQSLWLLGNSHYPFVTVRGLHVLGDHFTPVLYPVSLLYRFGFDIRAVLWLQTLALASGVIPLYRLGLRLSGSERVGLGAGVAYLLYPPLRSLNLCEFHPIALATPALLFALQYAFERRAIPMLAACFWMLLCKQETAVVVACLGIWYAWRWRQPRALLLAAGGILWFAAATRTIAWFAGTSESSYIELYSQYGNSTGEVLKTFLFHPWEPLSALGAKKTWTYLLVLLAPLAFLPLRSPGILWLLAFPLALNLFSNRILMRTVHYHYNALLIPVLLVAALAAYCRISDPRRRRWTAGAWIACCLVSTFAVKLDWQRAALRPDRSPAESRAALEVLAGVPREASVAATGSLVPHLAERKKIYLFPNPFWPLMTGPSRQALRQQEMQDHPAWDRAEFQARLRSSGLDYLILECRPQAKPRAPQPGSPWAPVRWMAETLRCPAYGLVADSAGVWVLRRGADHAAGLQLLGLAPGDPVSRFEAVVAARVGTGVLVAPPVSAPSVADGAGIRQRPPHVWKPLLGAWKPGAAGEV